MNFVVIQEYSHHPRFGVSTTKCPEFSLRGGLGLICYLHDDFKSHSGVVFSLGAGTLLARARNRSSIVNRQRRRRWLQLVTDWIMFCDIGISWRIRGIECRRPRYFWTTWRPSGCSRLRSVPSLSTRDIAILFYFVKDRMLFVGINDKVADILSKPLQGAKFKELRAKLIGDCNSV